MKVLKKVGIALCIMTLCITVVNGEEVIRSIEAVLQQAIIENKGDVNTINSIMYNNSTYVQLDEIAEIMDMSIEKKEDPNTDRLSIQLEEEKLLDGKVVHGFYTMNSNQRYNEMVKDRSIRNFNSLSYGWSAIYEANGQSFFTLEKDDDYYLPQGANEVLEETKALGIGTSLMVFTDVSQLQNGFKSIYENDAILEDILVASKSFDAVTIDFEFIDEANQMSYIEFLTKLNNGLKVFEKQLYVAVPVSINYDYYDYRGIFKVADFVILMAHDYEAKSENRFYGQDPVMTPQSPINSINEDIQRIKDSFSDSSYMEKGLLQISFAATQWENKNGYVQGQPNHPTYSMIYDRVYKEVIEKGQSFEDIVKRGESSLNPYVMYTNNDTGNLNTIWYEDWVSVESKLRVVDEKGLGGISLWYLRTIPNYYNTDIHMDLDIWNRLSEEIR